MKSTHEITCTFCGAKVTNHQYQGGEWHCKDQTVYCCHTCATSVLPRLIADSVHTGRQDHYTRGKAVVETLEGPFWKAMTNRAESALKG